METANTKKTEAPKWGTKEWIAAHPWSKMDRKRRRRVLAALPGEFSELVEQDVGHVPFLDAVVAKVSFRSKQAADRVARLMSTIDTSAVKVLDYAVAAALELAWAAGSGKTK